MVTVNYVLMGFVTIYLAQLCASIWLEQLNCSYLKERDREVPPIFKGVIDAVKLAKAKSYNLDKSRLHQIQGVTLDPIFLGVILSGLLPALDFLADKGKSHYVLAGVLFFLVVGLGAFLVSLPFDYYHTFVVEEKYGFNQASLKIWITDHLKQGILSVIFLFLLLSPVFWLIRTLPHWWWFWGFLVVSLIQILLTVLYPVLIAPLFNKFEPLKDQELAKKVRKQMQEAGIRIKDVLQMDAGKRSRHTNAYFTGLGKTKRIVFYDTLLSSHTHEEILAVLAHEAGHFRGKHIVKQLILFEAAMLVGFYLTYLMMRWELIRLTFGFAPTQSHVGLLLIVIFWEKAGYFLTPLYMALSRHFERQADLFSRRLLKSSKPIVDGLKRLAADNLANLSPHPLYVWFNYSHPPLVERITLLEGADGSDGT